MGHQLPRKTAEKLAKICGLLGSAHDGERAAAAIKASELLKSHKLTWREFVLAATTPTPRAPKAKPAPPPPPPPPESGGSCITPDDWVEIIADIIAQPPHLHPNEHEFLRKTLEQARQGRRPSQKQAAWINKIARRTR